MHCVEAHGARIPAFGFGTFRLDGSVARRMVGYALRDRLSPHRYRADVRQRGRGRRGDRGCGRPARRDLADHQDLARQFPRRRPAARGASRASAGCAPSPTCCCCTGRTRGCRCAETLGALNAVKRRGLARHIGISNCPRALIRELGRAQRGAADPRPGRVPPLSQPAGGARGAARPRHGAHRLLAGRPGQGVRRPDAASESAREHGKNPGPGRAALADPAGRRQRDPALLARGQRQGQSRRSSTSRSRARRWPRSGRSPGRAAGS